MSSRAKGALWIASYATIALALPRAIFAHAFGQSYVLPVPFWMYTYGSAAALVLSFAILGYVADTSVPETVPEARTISNWKIIRFFRHHTIHHLVQIVSVFLLAIVIFSGFAGVNVSQLNINMTLFWIIFLLGMSYASALFGNIWRVLNPWRVLVRWYGIGVRSYQGAVYPQWLGMWPAVALYASLIWFELIGKGSPLTLSIVLCGYSAYLFIGAWIFGKEEWFAHADIFTVFFGLIATLSLFDTKEGIVRARMPFAKRHAHSAQSMSELVFIIFMIASTSFDGFQETLPMLRLYLHSFSIIPVYDVFRTIALLCAPALFLGVYFFCIWLAKRFTHSTLSVRTLAFRFAYTLLPIALAYNIAHYYTLLLVQGQNIIRLISDPFGYGWNLFGTAHHAINVGILQAGFIWHSQVIVLLAGHIVSVYSAHVVSMDVFKSRKKVIFSQIPLLFLMVFFTVAGLWILSQPIVSG